MEKEDFYQRMVRLGELNNFTDEIQLIKEKLQDQQIREAFTKFNT